MRLYRADAIIISYKILLFLRIFVEDKPPAAVRRQAFLSLICAIIVFRKSMSQERKYIAIDLKSFYASVECVERGLNPLTTNLVVADVSRTEKTICLAVSPSLKKYGISGRARLFDVIERVTQLNNGRRRQLAGRQFAGKSVSEDELNSHPELEADYIAATPRMALYVKYSTRIYDIYLKYISENDIHVYSIDEVFMDVTDYLGYYKMSAHELAMTIIRDVLSQTGITATAGIGTNLYLCKIAMDIVAKHIPADKDGVRIAELDEMTYRRTLWDHEPLTDFWRVGRGIANKLEKYGIRTMGQIARYSIDREELFYRLFGVNAELLIDHAWGWEPCTMDMVKSYRSESNSLCNGQVLQYAYDYKKARIVLMEMADAASLDLLDKHLVTDQIVLTIGYDTASITDPDIRNSYHGEIVTDRYGRKVPKHAHGTANIGRFTSSASLISETATRLYDRIVNPQLLIRRINLTTNHVMDENRTDRKAAPVELDLFTDYEQLEKEKRKEDERLEKERRMQKTLLKIKKKYGKNTILKGLNFEDGATARMRNNQIGGHNA